MSTSRPQSATRSSDSLAQAVFLGVWFGSGDDWLFAPTSERETRVTAATPSHWFRRIGQMAGVNQPALYLLCHVVATHLVDNGTHLPAPPGPTDALRSRRGSQHIAPLPDLAATVAEGGSQGLVVLAFLQDLSQARARWDRAADGFLTLFTHKLILPGAADTATLKAISTLAGETDAQSYPRTPPPTPPTPPTPCCEGPRRRGAPVVNPAYRRTRSRTPPPARRSLSTAHDSRALHSDQARRPAKG